MPARVIISVVEGKLAGQKLDYDEHGSCIIGRSRDCILRLPDDADHTLVSRHHCLLDINPPDARIRDMGSLNGTFVNGVKIGQREKDLTATSAAHKRFPEHDLKDGDIITLDECGATKIKVSLERPATCLNCGAEIPPGKGTANKAAGPERMCETCNSQARKIPQHILDRRCARCGSDVAVEVGESRLGEYVCKKCKSQPEKILQSLLDQAEIGHKAVKAIYGYNIVREIGRGGMGAVYLAQHKKTGQYVALKVMLPRVAVDARSKMNFLREVENNARLKHPNVVAFHHSGCSDGTFFFAMEYCEGGSLEKLIAARGRLATGDAMRIIFGVLEALQHAHQIPLEHVRLADGGYGAGRGLVHRDINPHNILLTEVNGRQVAKIADFGVSKAFDLAGLTGFTLTGDGCGHPSFLPRQQVVDYRFCKPEVDVWAAAACLYAMLTGVPPRDFPSGKDRLASVLQSKPVPIRQRNSKVPEPLARVIDAALEDHPEIKIKTALELTMALKKATCI